jgi:hypothetical protein
VWKTFASQQGWRVVRTLAELGALASQRKNDKDVKVRIALVLVLVEEGRGHWRHACCVIGCLLVMLTVFDASTCMWSWAWQALLALPEPQVLVKEEALTLESRQSRVHEFAISPGTTTHLFDITVTIVRRAPQPLPPPLRHSCDPLPPRPQMYQGTFGLQGYRLGRLAACLYRLQPSAGDLEGASVKPLSVQVGYAPLEMQSLNTPDSMGKLVIYHCPRRGPLNPGQFQVRQPANQPRALILM